MSRVNHNVNYMYDVEGETVWEKLRTIRGMLKDRERAYEINKLNIEESAEKFKHDTTSSKYKNWLINKEFNQELLQDCINEVKFLKAFEKFLAEEAEKTRIPGATDDEMYEINFFTEIETRLVRKAQAQIMSRGSLDEELILRLNKHRGALEICIQQGLITEQVKTMFDTPLLPHFSTHSTLFLTSKNTDKEAVTRELPQIGSNVDGT